MVIPLRNSRVEGQDLPIDCWLQGQKAYAIRLIQTLIEIAGDISRRGKGMLKNSSLYLNYGTFDALLCNQEVTFRLLALPQF